MNARFLIPALIVPFLSMISFAEEPEAKRVSGIDQELFSKTISPGDNFYLYANEKWLDTTEIPADKSNYGIFTVLDDMTRRQVRELIEQAAAEESAPGSAAQKVGDLYQSVLDLDARNEAGIAPIQDLLLLINRSNSKRELAGVLGSLTRSGVYGPIVPYVNVDARDSDSYAVYVTQSGLTLPDRDYYLEDEARYVELRGKFEGLHCRHVDLARRDGRFRGRRGNLRTGNRDCPKSLDEDREP